MRPSTPHKVHLRQSAPIQALHRSEPLSSSCQLLFSQSATACITRHSGLRLLRHLLLRYTPSHPRAPLPQTDRLPADVYLAHRIHLPTRLALQSAPALGSYSRAKESGFYLSFSRQKLNSPTLTSQTATLLNRAPWLHLRLSELHLSPSQPRHTAASGTRPIKQAAQLSTPTHNALCQPNLNDLPSTFRATYGTPPRWLRHRSETA